MKSSDEKIAANSNLLLWRSIGRELVGISISRRRRSASAFRA